MTHPRIAITGMGIISSIGNTVEEHLHALKNGIHGIGDIRHIESRHKGHIKTGSIPSNNEDLCKALQISSDSDLTRTAILGIHAAREAILSAGITAINEEKTGLISSTSVGGMDMTEQYFYSYEDLPAKQKYIAAHDAGQTSLAIAKDLGLKGMVSTISTACSSAANAIMMGARLIQNGILDRVIVGGADALSKFTINGFNSLMILTDEYNRPFDENRKGLNLGEAAAYLVLESDKMITRYTKKPMAYLIGYGNANDAYHQTASSENGEGAYLAMQEAFRVAGISPSQIDYINVHGTATPNNDLSEGIAIGRVFRNTPIPDFSSTKPFTGHTLAAAAAIEAVFSILSIKHNLVFPNLHFETAMTAFDMIPATHLIEKNIQYVLSNSFGFGGNCSTLIFAE